MRDLHLLMRSSPLLFCIFFTILLLIRNTAASKCVVTKWKEWSECLGNCEFAQRVRNRDVLRPPFPERDGAGDERRTGGGGGGEWFVRECPPLYEAEACKPRECGDESPFVMFPSAIFKRLPTRAWAATTASEEQQQEVQQQKASKEKSLSAERRSTAKNARKNVEKLSSSASAETPRRAEANKAKIVDEKHAASAAGGFTSSASSERQQRQNPKQQRRSKAAGIEILGSMPSPAKEECPFQNQRCCRTRTAVNSNGSCSDGGRPRQLIRWYRKKEDQFCRPYKMPFCDEEHFGGSSTIMALAFASESECLELCFSDQEKTVLPNFRVI